MSIANAGEVEECLDNKKVFGAVLTDLSKAFDCHNHELVIAKPYEYVICLSSLKSEAQSGFEKSRDPNQKKRAQFTFNNILVLLLLLYF